MLVDNGVVLDSVMWYLFNFMVLSIFFLIILLSSGILSSVLSFLGGSVLDVF